MKNKKSSNKKVQTVRNAMIEVFCNITEIRKLNEKKMENTYFPTVELQTF